MATVKMMQGDSYAVFFALKLSGEPLTPDVLSDVEIYVGDNLRKLYSAGEVFYDTNFREWFFIPSQMETLEMEPESYEVQARVKFRNGQYSAVKGIRVGMLTILDGTSKEVI